jgi:hypothetical protein
VSQDAFRSRHSLRDLAQGLERQTRALGKVPERMPDVTRLSDTDRRREVTVSVGEEQCADRIRTAHAASSTRSGFVARYGDSNLVSWRLKSGRSCRLTFGQKQPVPGRCNA